MKVLGIGNSEEFNYLIVKKEEGFFEWLNDFLCKGFGGASPSVKYYEDTKDGETFNVKKVVKNEIDIHEYYDTESEVRVDLFYGKDAVFLTFFCSAEKRKVAMKVLEKISEFEE